MAKSILKQSSTKYSPIAASSEINHTHQHQKKELAAAVILTSLVDAFSILVIYLLVSLSHSGEAVYISKDMKLPEASNIELLTRVTMVRIEKDKMFVENKEVQPKKLVRELIQLRKEIEKTHNEGGQGFSDFSLMVQADKEQPFAVLSQVIQAGSHAGFQEVKFSVLAK